MEIARLYCCLLFQLTLSNMSKNVLLVSIRYPVSSTQIRVLILDTHFLIPRSNVENNGFEPLTPCVQGRCSSQLS
jgi:hypothetical protein